MSYVGVYNFLAGMYVFNLQKKGITLRSPQMAEVIELGEGTALEAAEENGVNPEEIVSFCLARLISDTHQISSDAHQVTPSHRAQRSD